MKDKKKQAANPVYSSRSEPILYGPGRRASSHDSPSVLAYRISSSPSACTLFLQVVGISVILDVRYTSHCCGHTWLHVLLCGHRVTTHVIIYDNTHDHM